MLGTEKEQGFSEAGVLRDIFDDNADPSMFEDAYDYSSDSDLSDEEGPPEIGEHNRLFQR